MATVAGMVFSDCTFRDALVKVSHLCPILLRVIDLNYSLRRARSRLTAIKALDSKQVDKDPVEVVVATAEKTNGSADTGHVGDKRLVRSHFEVINLQKLVMRARLPVGAWTSRKTTNILNPL